MDDTIKTTINASLISAFTIAAALIWKDVITDFIHILVPQQDELFFKFIAAVLASLVVVIGIYMLINTEKEAEIVVNHFTPKKKEPDKKSP